MLLNKKWPIHGDSTLALPMWSTWYHFWYCLIEMTSHQHLVDYCTFIRYKSTYQLSLKDAVNPTGTTKFLYYDCTNILDHIGNHLNYHANKNVSCCRKRLSCRGSQNEAEEPAEWFDNDWHHSEVVEEVDCWTEKHHWRQHLKIHCDASMIKSYPLDIYELLWLICYI